VLSGGEQQRLALARAWALRPEVLFLDEPTASLDPGASAEVERIIQAIHAAGTKIVMCTHNLGQARRLGDEILFLNKPAVERAPAGSFSSSRHPRRRFLEGVAMVATARAFLGALVTLRAFAAGAQERFAVASTSTEQSGLFGHILPIFQSKSGIQVRVVALGTGQALDLARRGDADVVFVHAKAAEEKFLAEGYGVKRMPVMYNDFVLIGPKSDPAKVGGGRTSPKR
jgi:energy-coupling factor transporter ATP-binding protein EcfA2